MAVAAIAIAAGAVGAIGSGFSASSQKRADRRMFKRQERRLNAAVNLMNPSNIISAQRELLPQFRELLVSQLGPGYLQGVQARLSRSPGLRQTGTGKAFESAAATAPEFTAFAEALNRAIQIREIQSNIRAGGAGMVPRESGANPFASALLGGASGVFGAMAGAPRPSAGPAAGAAASMVPPGMANANPAMSPLFPSATGGKF